ncbi:MAG: hypothetical protein QNJ70_23325 [Xenococcaceae cyanobacterium MO_207.B15]|nr:hypothetical protein [Xenococcaceae cyanobacterium MO_207.B15]MDJ0743135.1 hypothetical protein [Xenococcaceae cyanobacterium MO_167.B27]
MFNAPPSSILQKANLIGRQNAYRLWHRHQSQSYILRTQLGFNGLKSSRPSSCIGCIHYHGKAYGQTLATRTTLVCGFHPYGWSATTPCPDWKGDI